MVDKNVDININVIDNVGKTKQSLNSLIGTLNKLKSLQLNIKQQIFDAKSLGKSKEHINILNKRLQQTTINIQKVNHAMMQLPKIIKTTNRPIQSLGQKMQALTGPFLSLLFFGMMLQKVFTDALKSVFEGYKKAIPESHKFNVLTNKLSANWEYFKFQLADALANSPLFQAFIGYIINILNWLQKLSPETKVFLGTTMAVIAAFGFMLFMVGQIGLGMQGLITFSELFATKVGKFTWGKLGNLAIIAGVIAALYLGKKAWDDYAESSDNAKVKADNLSEANSGFVKQFSLLIDSIFNVSSGMETWGDISVFIGANIQNMLSFLGTTAAWVFKEIIIGINKMIISGKDWIRDWKDLADDFLDISKSMAFASDSIFGTNLELSVDNAIGLLNNFGGTMLDTTKQYQNISEAQANYDKQLEDYKSSITNTIDAVNDYKESLKKLEQQGNATDFMESLNDGSAFGVDNVLNDSLNETANIMERIAEISGAISNDMDLTSNISSVPDGTNNSSVDKSIVINIEGMSFDATGSETGVNGRRFVEDLLAESGLQSTVGQSKLG